MEEFEIVRAQNLPAATSVSDNDMLLVIQGPAVKRVPPSLMKGKQGEPGLTPYLGITDTHIMWRQGPTGSWQNLVSLEKIRGPRGEKPVFRSLAGTLQLKYEGEPDTAYKSVIDREELKMKFTDLTSSEIDLLKLHFSDLSSEDIYKLQLPAIEAGKDVREEMNALALESQKVKNDLLQLGATLEKNNELWENDHSRWRTDEDDRRNEEIKRRKSEIIRNKKTDTAVDRLNTLSDHRDEIRDGYWYRWNEITGEYENTNEPANSIISVASFDIDLASGNLNMYSNDNYTGPKFGLDEEGILTVTV